MNTSPHIHSALAADISARRIAAGAGAGAVTVRRRRAPLAVLAARLRPAAGRRAAQPAS